MKWSPTRNCGDDRERKNRDCRGSECEVMTGPGRRGSLEGTSLRVATHLKCGGDVQGAIKGVRGDRLHQLGA